MKPLLIYSLVMRFVPRMNIYMVMYSHININDMHQILRFLFLFQTYRETLTWLLSGNEKARRAHDNHRDSKTANFLKVDKWNQIYNIYDRFRDSEHQALSYVVPLHSTGRQIQSPPSS